MIDLEAFRSDAHAWLAAHKGDAPRDYGAIIPAGARRLRHRLAEAALRRRVGRHPLARRPRRPRPHPRPQRDLDRGMRPRRCARVHQHGRDRPRGNGHPEVRHRGAEARPPAGDARGRAGVVPALQRAWRRQRPRIALDAAPSATASDGSSTARRYGRAAGATRDWGILMARTDPDAPKHKGISFFLMDMALPGIEVRPLRQMTGEAEFDEVFFTDVEMPIDALIGPENEGWMVGMATLTSERGHIGASIIGLERRLEQIAALGDRRPRRRRPRPSRLDAARAGTPTARWRCGRARSRARRAR